MLLWGLLNIKFYDKYSSFLLFLLFSVARAGAWPACRAVQPGAGGLALYGLLELVTHLRSRKNWLLNHHWLLVPV